MEPHFHPDSYGYRPGKSAHQAVEKTRRMCWRYDWVLDLDARGFFDNIDHELMLKAARKYSDYKWVLLYIDRWLKAPAQLPDGSLQQREKGTTIKELRLHRRSDLSLDKIAALLNPQLREWIQYYGRFRRSELYCVFRPFEATLGRWAARKYKRLRRRWGRAMRWLREISSRQPRLFAHWHMLPQSRNG